MMSGRVATDPSLAERLAVRLKKPLPGRVAQSQCEPELSFGRHYAPAPDSARPAAVLALLYWHHDKWYLPLTVRPATMADHAGQISFPGGAIEAGESSDEAALRELEEELGVPREGIQLLGPLTSLYLFVTDFAVSPWVAAIDHRPDFAPCAREVAKVLEVPLDHLLDRRHRGTHVRHHGKLEFSAPHIDWQQYHIWGATGMMLSELLAVIEDLAVD